MRFQSFLAILLGVLFCGGAVAQTQDIDKELSDLADKLVSPIKDSGKKKVTVIDFTDLDHHPNVLGRYIADQLTVDLVSAKHDFAVLDRENLNSILKEHNLTAQGLVDPENAKQLGQFAGVDAIILGSFVPRGNNISLTARVVTTDTAEVVGAAKATFRMDDSLTGMLTNAATEASGTEAADTPPKQATGVVKKLGDLRVELSPLRVSNDNDYKAPEFLETMTLANQNPKKSIWVGLHAGDNGGVFAQLTSSDGTQYGLLVSSLSGIQINAYPIPRYGYPGPPDPIYFPTTELKPGDSIATTCTFVGSRGRLATPGTCNLQIEFLVGRDYVNGRGPVSPQNLVTSLEAK